MYETRVARVFAVFAVCLGALTLRAFTLQVGDRERVLAEHEKRVHGQFVLAPRRGEIQWAGGEPMAWNDAGFSVEIDLGSFFAHRWKCGTCGAVVRRNTEPPNCADCGAREGFSLLPAPDAIALAKLAGVPLAELDAGLVRVFEKSRAHPDYRTFELIDEVDRDTAVAVALAAGRFPGISVRARAGRASDPVAKSIVGATRPAYPEDVETRRDPDRAAAGERVYTAAEVFAMTFGKTGLESTFDDLLRGDPGRAHRVGRLNGRVQPPQVDIPVADGATLRTTLRRSVQSVAEETVATAEGDAAAVVVDLATGGVVAIASKSRDGLHHAVAAMRPGSVFKLTTALALLETGVSVDETVECDGAGRLPSGARYVCDEVHHSVSFRDAFAGSCNAYFATMAERVGPEAMLRANRELGFDVNPQLELRGSPAGLDPFWKAGSRWYAADMGKIGIGQGKALVSPLQVALAYGRVATGGRLLVPHLVEEAAPSAAAIDPSLARFAPLLTDAARGVVQYGTGKSIRELRELDAAGKTGTGDVDAHGKLNNAWFVAFAPASSPRYVAAVVFEKVKEHGGARSGRPVARLLAEALK